MRFRAFFVFLCLFALPVASPAASGKVFFEDKTASLTIDQILAQKDSLDWRPVTSVVPRFGFTRSRIWLRFRADERSLDPLRGLMLELPTNHLAKVDLYGVKGNRVLLRDSTGIGVPVSERGPYVMQVGAPTFNLPAPREPEMEIYLSASSHYPVSLPVNEIGAANFAFHHWSQVLFLGAFLGTLIIAAIYNGFLAFFLRSRLYLNYSLFVIFISLAFLPHEGLSVQLLWPEWPWWAMRELHVFNAFAVFFYSMFVREFLESRRVAPWLDRTLLLLASVSTLRAFWILFDTNHLVSEIGFMSAGLVNVVVLAIAAKALWNKVRSATYFFASSLCFNVFAILYILQESNLIWIGSFINRGPHLGTVIEVVLLSLALADRIRKLNIENMRQREVLIYAEKMSALGRMAGEIAHEINNPLAIIHGNAVLIRKHEISEPVRDCVSTIEYTANRISKVVKGIRALARNSDRDPFAPVLLSSVLQDAISLCEERATKAKVQIISPDRDAQLRLQCRGSEICQVLVNLINNAIDALEGHANPSVEVLARKNGEMIELSVADNGHGIPAGLRGRIQEPFFTTKEAGKGLGLGLSIARTIVEAHGGKLWLCEKSALTRLVFTVPAAK